MSKLLYILMLLSLVGTCCAQEPKSITAEVLTFDGAQKLRAELKAETATAQSTADNAERVAKEALTVITGIDSVLQKLKPTAPNPPYLDVTTDTPLGKHKIGDDITGALQWSLDNLHEHRRPIMLPAGEWKLSQTIRTPYKSGLTLLGAGTGGTDADLRMIASRTLIKWVGKTGETMIEYRGSHASIGNFTLMGTGSETGIVVTNPSKGLGVGTVRFAPIHAYSLGTIVQCGTTPGMANCDNLHFEWLVANKCKCAYRGVNGQGVDIVFERLNLNNTPIGIEMDGGGSLWVQYSTIIHACTLLKITGAADPRTGPYVGKYNGYFRLSNTKVDSQAKDGFCLVDCAEPYPIRILADGGLYSWDSANGTFVRLTGGNHLEIRDWTATCRKIQGVSDSNYKSPTVVIRGSRIWGDHTQIFDGVRGRIHDSVSGPYNQKPQWIDYESEGK